MVCKNSMQQSSPFVVVVWIKMPLLAGPQLSFCPPQVFLKKIIVEHVKEASWKTEEENIQETRPKEGSITKVASATTSSTW